MDEKIVFSCRVWFTRLCVMCVDCVRRRPALFIFSFRTPFDSEEDVLRYDVIKLGTGKYVGGAEGGSCGRGWGKWLLVEVAAKGKLRGRVNEAIAGKSPSPTPLALPSQSRKLSGNIPQPQFYCCPPPQSRCHSQRTHDPPPP